MKDFKIGERVQQISTGDKGTIVEDIIPITRDRVSVFWETGDDKGMMLSIGKSGLQKIDTAPSVSSVASVQQALDSLISQGYTVSLSR